MWFDGVDPDLETLTLSVTEHALDSFGGCSVTFSGFRFCDWVLTVRFFQTITLFDAHMENKMVSCGEGLSRRGFLSVLVVMEFLKGCSHFNFLVKRVNLAKNVDFWFIPMEFLFQVALCLRVRHWQGQMM